MLITGNGLVATALSGKRISTQDIDLREFQQTLVLFKEIQPTEIIHTAGRVGGLGGNMNYKGEFFFDNIMINTNVIEAARQTGVKKVVSFLSTCVFPDNPIYPLTEDQIHTGEPHTSNYPYAYAKRMLDVQARAYREQYGMNIVNVIPTNIYGPNDNFNLENGHVIPSLIHKCYLAKKNNTDFIIWGSGKPLREFIFTKDIAILTMWALENYNEEEPIIFSTSEEISIKDIALLIAKYMKFDGNIIFDKTKSDGQYRKPSSNKKLMSYLPNFKFTSIEDGLKETIEWFNNNYKIARK